MKKRLGKLLSSQWHATHDGKGAVMKGVYLSSLPLPYTRRLACIGGLVLGVSEMIFGAALRSTIATLTSVTDDCHSFKCSDGYTLINHDNEKKYMLGTCKESQCCGNVCSSFHVPKRYFPVLYSDTTVCKDSGCSKDLSCEDGEAHLEYLVHRVSVTPVVHASATLQYIAMLPATFQARWYVNARNVPRIVIMRGWVQTRNTCTNTCFVFAGRALLLFFSACQLLSSCCGRAK